MNATFVINLLRTSIISSFILGEDWRNEKDKLLKKYSHVRGKLSVLEKCPRAMASSPQPQINQHDPHDYNPKCIVDLEGENSRLRSDRDYYQKEYLRLISQTKNDAVGSYLNTFLFKTNSPKLDVDVN